MNGGYIKFVEWFLRVAIALGFLSAVADRFGLWPADHSVFSASAAAFALSAISTVIIPLKRQKKWK